MYPYPSVPDVLVPGVIIASAQHRPPAASEAYSAAFDRLPGHGRRRKPWIELAPQPPLVPAECLRQLHRNQLHTAVARALGKKGGNFCAALMIDLCGASDTYTPTPQLVMATTRFRLPNRRDDDRIDLAILGCNEEFLRYYRAPAPQELAYIVFEAYSRFAPYKAVLTCGGLVTDDWATFGQMRPIR